MQKETKITFNQRLSTMKRIVISACTYKRPDGLMTLLSSLAEIQTPEDAQLSVRIIDNEPTPAAKELVEKCAKDMPTPLHYAHEPEGGIAPARNRALNEAKDDDFLVFVDDDETVAKDWLLELWDCQKRNKAEFVQGPVTLTVEDKADEWWVETLLFRQKTFPDNAPRHESWTNNVMIDMSFVRAHNLQFDPSLKYDGGSDTLFFQKMCKAGGKGVFAAKAIVYEIQPESRLTWKWATKRQFRYGNTRAMVARKTKTKLKAFLDSFVRAGACGVFGLLHLPTTIVKGRVGFANSLAYFARGCGILWGLTGKRYLEYQRNDAA